MFKILNICDHFRGFLPFPVRVVMLRVKRYLKWLVETPNIARTHLPDNEQKQYRHRLVHHVSPLERVPGSIEPRLQRGKERNVAVAAKRLNGLLIQPFEIFSYHRIVGRPSRLRGFRQGLELRDGKPSQGVGGGCCAISNMLYLLALQGGMKIIERHRHCLDLFPDYQRSVPFGCEATVFYNYADLRFENPLEQSVLLKIWIENRFLIGELWCIHDPGWAIEIYEKGHRFFQDGTIWFRENRIYRRFTRSDVYVLLEQEVAHNYGKVMYKLEDQSLCGRPL
jgi:vancomycin resistance protein VanW